MFFILLGIGLSVVIIFLGENRKWKDKTVSAIIAGVFICSFLVGLLVPVAGVHETAETIELATLNDGKFYLNEDADNHYTYATKDSRSNGISGNVVIVEDSSYQEPKLVICTRMPKITFWSFGFGAHEIEYVFYLPIGAIARNS